MYLFVFCYHFSSKLCFYHRHGQLGHIFLCFYFKVYHTFSWSFTFLGFTYHPRKPNIGRKYLRYNSREECCFIIIHINVCQIFIAYLYACLYFLFDIVGMFLTLVAFILFCTLTVGLEHLIYHFVVPFAKRQPSGSFWRGRLLMFFSQVGITIPEIWHVVSAKFHCAGTYTQLP